MVFSVKSEFIHKNLMGTNMLLLKGCKSKLFRHYIDDAHGYFMKQKCREVAM